MVGWAQHGASLTTWFCLVEPCVPYGHDIHAVFPGTARDFLSNSGRCGQAGVEFAHSVFITVSLAEENLQLALFFGHIRPVLV